jgi:hypothetical protein
MAPTNQPKNDKVKIEASQIASRNKESKCLFKKDNKALRLPHLLPRQTLRLLIALVVLRTAQRLIAIDPAWVMQ